MAEAPLTLGTAGHIDHGKTALIEALTGVNTDRLPQERERGISIELGFARLALPSGRELGVVDVPGHERFVRTMVAGATGIDLFLLVVAADDGPMPQTREHLAVLELLGVGAGVVALTKVDAVDGDQRDLAAAEVQEMLAATPYAGTRPVPVSARAGTGLDDLTAALERAAGALAPRSSRAGPTRMHVDRCFTLRGIGTVVTGTLWAGEIREGEEIRLEPGSRPARVRSVHVHDERKPAARAGRRVALNLAGVERREVQRGDVVVGGASNLAPTHFIDAEARLLPGARPLRPGTRVQVHHGTRDTPARIVPLESGRFDPGAQQLVQLRLEQPLVAAAGDRFVLRQVAPPDTLGGGFVVDPRARKHGPGAVHAERLQALASGDPLAVLRVELEAAQSGVGSAVGADLLDQLGESGDAVRVGGSRPRWFAPRALARARSEVLRAVTAAGPGRGVGAGALARITALDAAAVTALLDDLVAEGAVREQAGVFSAAGAPHALDDPLAQTLAELVRADGTAPRGPDALADAAGVERPAALRSLERLAAEGVLVRLRAGVYFDRAALATARAAVESACARDGSVTIAALRDALGTSRKHAQAILEYLDQSRITRRRADVHVLRARNI